MNRAYSLLEIKAVDEERRELSGIATTPEPDRVGDIVEPMGAKFASELPLLWQHQHDKPVGTVKFDKPTKSGISFKASLPIIKEAGALKELVDMAWQAVKAKLVRGVSIGFRPVEYSFLDSGGVRFTETEIYELSLVTVPANASATIHAIKSIDTAIRAASGAPDESVIDGRKAIPGDSGTSARKGVFYTRNEGKKVNIQEQITALEAMRQTKSARMVDIQKAAIDAGRSKEAAEQEEFDTLKSECDSIEKELKDLKILGDMNVSQATAVDTTKTTTSAAHAARAQVVVKNTKKLDPGIAFARYAICLIKSKGDHRVAFQLAERHYHDTEDVVKLLKAQAEGFDLQEMMRVKATVPAGTSTDSTWAAPLVYANTFGGDFIEYLRPRTLIGQAQFRPVPFNVRIAGQTSGGTAGWVGQGKAKPVTKFDFNATTIPFTKIAAISVITQELARFSDPSAEALVRDSLADAVIARLDTDLFDPDLAAVANVSPAGLLNGVSPVAVNDNTIDFADPASVRCALALLWAPWDSTFMGARPAYYTTPAVARQLSMSREALGTQAFPGVTMMGGTLDGVPLRVSQYLANNGGSGGAPFILVDEAEVFLADDGQVALDSSDVATIEMSDTPVGSSSATVAASGTLPVSMWQTNSLALRAERFVWWGLRRTGAIQWIDEFPTAC